MVSSKDLTPGLARLLALIVCAALAPVAAEAEVVPAQPAPLSAMTTTPTPSMRQAADLGVSSRVQNHFEPSYITAGGGFNLTKPIDWGDLFYEAQIYVHYTWYDSARSKDHTCGPRFSRVMVPIRLQVRQYRTDSSPVKTPSFNPGIRWYFAPESWFGDDLLVYASIGAHHYSNGQSGQHYNPDGTINTENGSFSTDYVEESLYWDTKKTWTKLSLRQYLVSQHLTWESAQSHYYERGLVELSWRYDHRRRDVGEENTAAGSVTSVQLTGGYKYGRDYVSPGVTAHFQDNLQFTAEAFLPAYKSWNWQDLRFYLRFDHGYDYYNIHYQERMTRFQVGLVATNF